MIEAEQVFAIAGHRAAGRPHVARALQAAGYVQSFKEAFDRYIDFHGPAYVSHYKLSPEDAVKLVVVAGGLAVFGHPGLSNCDQIIPDLMAAGLRGIEAFHPGHDQAQTDHYLKLAKENGLLVTGGSDFHGAGGREVRLGKVCLQDELLERLRNEHLRGNRS
jgi:predicted metal-dependent phosphoesterase TrpH